MIDYEARKSDVAGRECGKRSAETMKQRSDASLSMFIRTDATATEVQLIATKRDIARTSCVRSPYAITGVKKNLAVDRDGRQYLGYNFLPVSMTHRMASDDETRLIHWKR
ncbi:hypothetical protein KCU89_g86, partial [Aureobasidium melanogenum]